MGKYQKTLKKMAGQKILYLMIVPCMIYTFIFSYYPLSGWIMAFQNYKPAKGYAGSTFVGLDQFMFLFEDVEFWRSVRNTLMMSVMNLAFSFVFAIVFALLLNEIKNKGMMKIYQSSMFLPYFLSWVVVSYCVFAFLNPEKGYFNAVIQQFGGEPVSWYTEKKYWPFIIIFMSQWKGMGYNTVVYLASICGIDKTYYEAAVLDGASKWQQIKYIPLPLLKPVITILLIMSVGGIFKADFGLFYQLPKNSGPLYPVTNVLDTYIFRALKTSGEIGMSSAAALFQSAVGFVLIMIANKIVAKVDSENALF